MNIISKGRGRTGSLNEVFKVLRRKRTEEELTFDAGHTSRDVLKKLLVICGKVGADNIATYQQKAKELGADFIAETGSSWVLTQKTIQQNYDTGKHEGVLLIGDNKELPGTQMAYQGAYTWTDFFFEDADGDHIPDIPVGRIYGPPETILYHMDPLIIDSNIAVVFDSQPGRSTRHVESLVSLGFDVEVLQKFSEKDIKIMEVCEFILQFSDGVFTSRIHGTPEQWASHNAVILSYQQAESIKFKGYPVIFSEACSTAQDGPLLKAFLNQGAVYIGSTLDTVNNIEPFDDWRQCAYCDGYKFGFLDLLDSHELIGQVKVGVDRGLYENLAEPIKTEIEGVRSGSKPQLETENAITVLEWQMFGNPMRRTTVGEDADFTPGKIIVDT
ncbi:MAG: C25 family cysteine peptidase [Candidatus Thorarchaeota archaeon]